MRVLICGGRDQDPETVAGWLEEHFTDCIIQHGFLKNPPGVRTIVIIEGGTIGADRGGCLFAMRSLYAHIRERANWDRDGNRAGPIRNQKIIDDHKPDLGIAFPGGVGTADMVRRLEKHNIPVVKVLAF